MMIARLHCCCKDLHTSTTMGTSSSKLQLEKVLLHGPRLSTSTAGNEAVPLPESQPPMVVERRGGFRHHLFFLGAGIGFPIGQEPYASFVTTRVHQSLVPSSGTTSPGMPGGSSPRSMIMPLSTHGSSNTLCGGSPPNEPNGLFRSSLECQQAYSNSALSTCCAELGPNGLTLRRFSSSAAQVVLNTLNQAASLHPHGFTATAVVSALDGSLLHHPFARQRTTSPENSLTKLPAGSPIAESTSPSHSAKQPYQQTSNSCDHHTIHAHCSNRNSCLAPAGPISNESLNGLSSQSQISGLTRYSPQPKSRHSPKAGDSLSPTSLQGQTSGIPLPLESILPIIQELRCSWPSIYIILWHPDATEGAAMRAAAFAAGANMVTFSQRDVRTVLTRISGQSGTGCLSCPWCGLSQLTPGDLWMHQPLYHIYSSKRPTFCEACGIDVDNLAVHIHEQHAPAGPAPELRTNYGSAVVVHRPSDNKFLLVQEYAGQGFWTPGGAANVGESLAASAVRECFEETGVEIVIKGLLEVQFDMSMSPPWRLAVFYAQPKAPDGGKVKTIPDFESAGACWIGLDELADVPWRCDELPLRWFPAMANGTATVLPLKVPTHAVEQFKDLVLA